MQDPLGKIVPTLYFGCQKPSLEVCLCTKLKNDILLSLTTCPANTKLTISFHTTENYSHIHKYALPHKCIAHLYT